jgi:NADH:ubiquinone oxidoreductase subunit 5 (subunit L)/multisubunit Na+/H+ antiporter MnhA subunit
MVTAGIFLLLRIATVLQWHTIVGIVGGFTIGFGGTVAVLTPDIKQIIAYSTTSQLG